MPEPGVVHCPAKIAHLFGDAAAIDPRDHLDLTASPRTHLTEDVQDWVAGLLEGRLMEAADLATRVLRQGFDLYLRCAECQAIRWLRAGPWFYNAPEKALSCPFVDVESSKRRQTALVKDERG